LSGSIQTQVQSDIDLEDFDLHQPPEHYIVAKLGEEHHYIGPQLSQWSEDQSCNGVVLTPFILSGVSVGVSEGRLNGIGEDYEDHEEYESIRLVNHASVNDNTVASGSRLVIPRKPREPLLNPIRPESNGGYRQKKYMEIDDPVIKDFYFINRDLSPKEYWDLYLNYNRSNNTRIQSLSSFQAWILEFENAATYGVLEFLRSSVTPDLFWPPALDLGNFVDNRERNAVQKRGLEIIQSCHSI
jgi:hypothetical protein